jgi:hypothetical protein
MPSSPPNTLVQQQALRQRAAAPSAELTLRRAGMPNEWAIGQFQQAGLASA